MCLLLVRLSTVNVTSIYSTVTISASQCTEGVVNLVEGQTKDGAVVAVQFYQGL